MPSSLRWWPPWPAGREPPTPGGRPSPQPGEPWPTSADGRTCGHAARTRAVGTSTRRPGRASPVQGSQKQRGGQRRDLQQAVHVLLDRGHIAPVLGAGLVPVAGGAVRGGGGELPGQQGWVSAGSATPLKRVRALLQQLDRARVHRPGSGGREFRPQ